MSVTWDAENRLTQYGGLFIAGYRPDSLRAWKQDSSGHRTYFLYSGGEPIIELDGQGNISAVNTFGPTGLLSRHSATGSTFYTFDAQGSVAQRLDASGNVLSSSIYDSFGNKVSTEPQSDPWGYNAQAGYYTDAETGLILCTHRYYDPTQGRWLNRDPIGYAGGFNLYGYVGNGAVDGVDPSGYSWIGDAWNAFNGCISSAFSHLGGAILHPFNPTWGPGGAPFDNPALHQGFADTSNPDDSDNNVGATPSSELGNFGRQISGFLKNFVGTMAVAGTCAVLPGGGGGLGGSPARAFSDDQAALVDIAKTAQKTGISPEEAQTLRGWADECGLPSRGPEAHPGRPFGQYPHIHIGPVNHIPVR